MPYFQQRSAEILFGYFYLFISVMLSCLSLSSLLILNEQPQQNQVFLQHQRLNLANSPYCFCSYAVYMNKDTRYYHQMQQAKLDYITLQSTIIRISLNILFCMHLGKLSIWRRRTSKLLLSYSFIFIFIFIYIFYGSRGLFFHVQKDYLRVCNVRRVNPRFIYVYCYISRLFFHIVMYCIVLTVYT